MEVLPICVREFCATCRRRSPRIRCECCASRAWQELSRGLCEAHPSRMLRALRACGALVALLPEVDALYAAGRAGDNAGAFTERALDWAAAQRFVLPVRYAILTQELGNAGAARGASKWPSRRVAVA